MAKKIFVFSLVICLYLQAFAGSAAAGYGNGIPVLLYHHVSDDRTDMPELTVTTAEFDRQMSLLEKDGFKTISPEQLFAYMAGEQPRLPEKPIVINFDDGYEDNYTNAFPLLKRHGFKAAIFMVGINFDRAQRLSSAQIRVMTAEGMVIGAHSMTHPDLTGLSPGELWHEVYDSGKKAEKVTGKRSDAFAYPGGFFTPAVVDGVQAAGYKGAFSVLPGLNRPDRDNIYLLRRIPVFSFTDFDALEARLSRNAPETSLFDYIPATADSDSGSVW